MPESEKLGATTKGRGQGSLMTDFTHAEMEVLVKRLDLKPSREELEWLTKCFNGYRDQLSALHALDLNIEEVGIAFLDPEGLTVD